MATATIMRGFMTKILDESVNESEIRERFAKYFWTSDRIKIDSEGRVIVHYCEPQANSRKIARLPVQFAEVTGTFKCSKMGLTSLKGGPTKAQDYRCDQNKLQSLEFGPTSVANGFSCALNKLTSLVGAPTFIG